MIASSFVRKTGNLYYNPGTLSSGSADPLSLPMHVRSLLRTGWGPRGDSGSARGRVRATQPASFSPQIFRKHASGSGPDASRRKTKERFLGQSMLGAAGCLHPGTQVCGNELLWAARNQRLGTVSLHGVMTG